MISCAQPIVSPGLSSSRPISPDVPQPASPPITRSRRYALLPPLPHPPDPPPTPPLPARSPLRLTRKPSLFEAKPPPPEPLSTSTTTSKRQHALLELLSSERAYASDLAIIRDVHLPLALGQPVSFSATSPSPTPPPVTPTSPSSQATPPMTKEDTRLIFGNIEDLAVFSEVFCDRLEEAMQGILDPQGDGKDRVAEVFMSMVCHSGCIPYLTNSLLLDPSYDTAIYHVHHPTSLGPNPPQLTPTNACSDRLPYPHTYTGLLIYPCVGLALSPY